METILGIWLVLMITNALETNEFTYCNDVDVLLTITQKNATNLSILYNRIDANSTKFESIIESSIYNEWEINNSVGIHTQCIDIIKSFHITPSLNISCHITDCNDDIDGLQSYLNSTIFHDTLSTKIYQQYGIETSINTIIKTSLSFLESPWNYTLPKLLSAVFAAFALLLILGYFHKRKYKLLHSAGVPMADNFYPLRLFAYLVALFITFVDINTTYYYFYERSVLHDADILLIVGSISLTLLFIQILMNGFLIKKIKKNEWIEIWLTSHRYLVIFLITMSNSFYCSLCFVNCNLFGMNMFMMQINRQNLEKMKIKPSYLIIIECLKLAIHAFALYYIYHDGYDAKGDEIEYFIMTSLIFGIFSLMVQFMYKYRSQKEYGSMHINIRIEIDNENINDKKKLKRQKSLVQRIKDILANTLGIDVNDVEVLNTKEILNGIIIYCMIYWMIEDKKDKTKMVGNKRMAALKVATGIELQQLLLHNIDEKEETDMTNSDFITFIPTKKDIKKKLNKASIYEEIQHLYGLHHKPCNISFDVYNTKKAKQ